MARLHIEIGVGDTHLGLWTIGDPHLGPIEPIPAGDGLTPRPLGARITPRQRLGQGIAADLGARGEGNEVFLLLLVGSKLENGPSRQAVLDAHDDADSGIGVADLLECDDVGEDVETGSTVFLGCEDAEQSKLAHLVEEATGKGMGTISLCSTRKHFATSKFARHVSNREMVVRKLEHGVSLR